VAVSNGVPLADIERKRGRRWAFEMQAQQTLKQKGQRPSLAFFVARR
jgi:hypothetical protein